MFADFVVYPPHSNSFYLECSDELTSEIFGGSRVAEGIVNEDKTVTLHWHGESEFTETYDSLLDVETIKYMEIVWLD